MATTDRAFKSVGNLVKLLPSGTVFLFQFLSPLLTNAGHCAAANKISAGGLLVACGLSCCFSSFTDSFVGDDGRVYYGVVTTTGLRLFSGAEAAGAAPAADLSRYKLRIGDFVHSSLALLVFAALALLDDNTAACFYPGMVAQEKTTLMVVPTVVGPIASLVLILFPNNRHGIGYPPSDKVVSNEAYFWGAFGLYTSIIMVSSRLFDPHGFLIQFLIEKMGMTGSLPQPFDFRELSLKEARITLHCSQLGTSGQFLRRQLKWYFKHPSKSKVKTRHRGVAPSCW